MKNFYKNFLKHYGEDIFSIVNLLLKARIFWGVSGVNEGKWAKDN